jgi:hypothetical protein
MDVLALRWARDRTGRGRGFKTGKGLGRQIFSIFFSGCLRSGTTREWEVRKFPSMHILEYGGVDPGGCWAAA